MTADTSGFSAGTAVSFSMMEAMVTASPTDRPASCAAFSRSGVKARRKRATMIPMISSGVMYFTNW